MTDREFYFKWASIEYDLKGLCHDVWSHFKSVKDVFKSMKTLNNSVCLRETGRFYARDVKVTGGDNSNKRCLSTTGS